MKLDIRAAAAAVCLLLKIETDYKTGPLMDEQGVVKALEPGHITGIAKENRGIAVHGVILHRQARVRRLQVLIKNAVQRGTEFVVTEQAQKRLPFVVARQEIEVLKAAVL